MLFADDIGMCSARREHVERTLEEWRIIMEERGLKISRKKTVYLGFNEHQDAEIHLQGEAVKRVKTFTYLVSTLSEDGELDAEVTQRVHSGWKNWKRVSGVLCDMIKGEVYITVVRPALMYGGRNMGVEEGTGKEIGGRRNENATMDVRSYEAGQYKKRKNKRDNESGGNHKESPGKKVEVVWGCDETSGTLRRKEAMVMKVHMKTARPKRRWVDKVKDDTASKRRECRLMMCTTVLHVRRRVLIHRPHIKVGKR